MALDRIVAEMLTERARCWAPNPPATDEQIATLCAIASFELPNDYLELLRFCNGGYGDLDAPPLLFYMDSIEESIERNDFWRKQGEFLRFWFIGSNAGLETIGFDLRSGRPWAIVMIDLIAGESSAERIANDMADFVNKIGRESDDSRE